MCLLKSYEALRSFLFRCVTLITNQKHMMRLLEMLHTRLMYHYKRHIIKKENCLWINKHHSSEFIIMHAKNLLYSKIT